MGQSQSSPPRGVGGGDEPGARNRELAKKEALLRKDLSQRSQEAWQQNDRAKAKEYSLGAKRHQSAVEAYNALAAREIFTSNNPTYLTTSSTSSVASFLFSLFSSAPSPSSALTQIDLHGLYVIEALPLVKEHLDLCKKHSVERTMIITGKGLHSVDGIAKIRPQVEKMLQEEEGVMIVKETGRAVNGGAFVVEFTKEESGWSWLWKGLLGN